MSAPEGRGGPMCPPPEGRGRAMCRPHSRVWSQFGIRLSAMHSLRIVLVLILTLGGSVMAADWPQWRGPHGSGIADDKNLPDRWTATENVAWKASLAGLGVSSPIVWGDRVFVTSQIGDGITRQGPRLVQRGDAAASPRWARDAPGPRRIAPSSSSKRSAAPTASGSGSTASRRWDRCRACTTSTTSQARVR